jgi:single-stranded-DNA-specific exonuclease
MRTLIWDPVVCDETATQSLAAALDVSPVVARLLWHRGHRDPEAAHRFLHPQLSHLHDPYGLADMRPAVDRLCAALERRERIAIHGDYDVDGVTSTVILRRALELLGGDVTHFIPERIRDGYGLQSPAVERLYADGVRVIVSVDCGIRSAEAARRARELGVDLIITDHHEPEAELPSALAVINPKRTDCTYPDKHLAGVGVAFKVVQALCERFDRQKWLPAFLKLAAIGTVADVVPLVGENRIIAKLGLERLSQGPHTVGLRTLLESAGLQNKVIDGFHVAFVIAPRVNAAGRMSTPDLATRLLLASDETQLEEVRRLAEQLGEENTRRQAYEADIVASSASWPPSWWMRSTSPPSSCRSRTGSRMGRAGRSRRSTCSAPSTGVRTCSRSTADTSRRRASRWTPCASRSSVSASTLTASSAWNPPT